MKIFEKDSLQALRSQTKDKLGGGRIHDIFDDLISVKKTSYNKHSPMYFIKLFWVADMDGNISLTRLCAIQLFDNYLPAV